MMVYSIAEIEYLQECTNHDEHAKHGSGEPVNKALWHYTTSYIQCLWCDITGPRKNTQFTPLFFASISLKPTEYLPNLLATKPRQIDVPEGLAKIICRNNLPNPSATPARGFYSPELGAIPARGIDLPERAPLPRSESPGKTRPATPPPPPTGSAQRRRGRGWETDPARLCILNRYFSFHSPHIIILHVSHDTHICILCRVD